MPKVEISGDDLGEVKRLKEELYSAKQSHDGLGRALLESGVWIDCNDSGLWTVNTSGVHADNGRDALVDALLDAGQVRVAPEVSSHHHSPA